jgi:hypothetical protein
MPPPSTQRGTQWGVPRLAVGGGGQTPYLDAIQRELQLRTSPLPERAPTRPTIARGTRDGATVGSRAGRQGKGPNHQRPRPQLVHGLPIRGRDNDSETGREARDRARCRSVHRRPGPQPAPDTRQRFTSPGTDS